MHEQVPRAARWPLAPRARLERAKTDLDFVAAILDCGCDDINGALGRIHGTALQHYSRARKEIEAEACEGR